MNQVQKTISDFVMKNVKDGKQAEAQALLDEAFAKQESGGLNTAYLMGAVPKLLGVLNPESAMKAKDMLMNLRNQG